MPVARFQMEDGRIARFEVPDGTTPEQAHAMIQEHLASQPKPQHEPLELAQEPGVIDNFVGGVKSGLKGAAQGIGQAVGMVSRGDVARQRQQDSEVLGTTAGKVGNFVGNAAAYLPAAFIPGVNTLAGGALVGAAVGALQPSVSDSETFTNAGTGLLGGAIGSKISQLLASRAASRVANAPKIKAGNDALKAAQKQGYVVPPSDAGAGTGSQILNALSGKIKTEQKASTINQLVTNQKAAQAIGLSPDEKITPEAIRQVRNQAGKAYEAVKGIGQIKTDGKFTQALDDIGKQFQGAAKDFPELVNDKVMGLIDSLKKPQFGADSAIDAIRILRDKADDAFRTGDKGLGKAQKQAADALEGMIERHLTSSGASPDLVRNFRDSRQLIAKTYTVEKALNQSTGNVKAGTIANELKKGRPLTGELKEVGAFAQMFPKANQEIAHVNPYSILDTMVGAGGLAVNPAVTAGVAARPVARSLILSRPYQRALVHQPVPGNTLTSVLRLGSKASTPLSALAATRIEDK